MIEQLILVVGFSCLVARIFSLDSYFPLVVFSLPTILYLITPHGNGVSSFVIAGIFDGAIITMMYLMPSSVKALMLAKDLVIITLISLALNIVGLALHEVVGASWLNQAYIVLYVVALISIVTRTGYGLRKGGGSAFLALDRQHGYKFCAQGDYL